MARAGKTRIPYTSGELHKLGPQITYSGRALDEIAFPLGGIGTGHVTLGGWGQLRDWEIQNRPAKGFAVKSGFFAINVRGGRGAGVTRVLQGPVGGSYTGEGHTLRRVTGECMPRFGNVTFKGEFPFAEVRLQDDDLPVEVTLEAFNPFIPLNADDSSIPAAILLYTVRNVTKRAVDVTVFGNLGNVIGESAPQGRVNIAVREPGLAGVKLSNAQLPSDSPQFGTMALAALWDDVEVEPAQIDEAVFRMPWYGKLWEALSEGAGGGAARASAGGTGTVAARARIEAGDAVTLPFILAWHFPNYEHWNKPEACAGDCRGATWQNWYATRWSDAWEAVSYVANNMRRLHDETVLFADSLFSSTLPPYVLDAVSANISILKSPTVLRLTDGTFYGFEGCNNTSGCCEGSCTHVWNYAQALAWLFPSLQRSQREADYRYAMREDGFIQFRLPLPLGTKPEFRFHPAADGQMGGILQVYREWLISGDTEWLKGIWPSAKKALEFAWKYWDADRDGVMEGMQHNTFDIEFYGPNTMMGSLYLGALRAAEEMARVAGDAEAAGEYRRLFEKGSAWTDANLFNGEYYEQKVEPDAHLAWPEPYRGQSEGNGRDDRFDWPRQQYGRGCLSDQLIGQWYARMLGLGDLYDGRHVRKAAGAIFRHNWRGDLRDHVSTLRIYATGDEAGLLVCTWPRGERPGYPVFYGDEVWCGVEYEVASLLIYEGMIEEGLAVVRGVRERHRGTRRNPWDEFECGHHYSRSMASYAVLLALSGFSCKAAEGRMGFAPRVRPERFRTFWSVGGAWGSYEQRFLKGSKRATLKVAYGTCELRELELAAATPVGAKVKAAVDGARVEARLERGQAGRAGSRSLRVVFDEPVTLSAGSALTVAF